MDFRDILKSFDNLSEGTTTTDKGTVHKAGPGGYGNRHGSEDVTDQYGKPIGRASLSKMSDAPAVKRGKGRPPKNADASGEVKKYDSSALSKAMGMGKAPKATGKPSVKHSLKEYFDQMEEALSEAGLAVQPMPTTPQQQQQKAMAGKPSFLIKDPANPNMPAITTQDPAVVQAAKSGTMTMQKPGAAPTSTGAKPATGAGSQVGAMAEGGDIGKHNNATTGFDALVRKLTPKYGKESAMKIAGAQLKKIKEAEAPQHFAQSSPISTGGRNPNSLEEGKKGVNPFAKKDDKTAKKDDKAEKIGKKVTKDIEKVEEGSKPDFLDLDKDGNKKESMKQAAKDKKKVKEGMEHHLQAARLEGKSHALRKMPYSCSHDDMEAARHYHEGFKEGLDECYGQMPILGRTAVGEVSSEVGDMASFGAHTPTMEGLHDDAMAGLQRTVDFAKQHGYRVLRSPAGKVMKFINKAIDHTLVARVDNEGDSINVNFEDWSSGTSGNDDASYFDQTFKDYYEKALEDHKYRLSQDEEDLDEVSRGKWLDQQARKPGDTFKAFGQTFHDKDVLEDSPFFESLETQLNALLESKEDVAEGMTVSISKGQQGAPDSVSVSAQDGEADQLLSIIKTAGLGLFGGEDKGFSAPEGSAGAHGGISVVDDHDGMMALMKKLSGGGEAPSSDFADEEGHSEEGHEHGEEEHTHEGEEDSCNECGMAYESCGCDHGDKEVVDEVESEDQMAYEVAEDNPPDNGSANSTNDEQGNAAANQALATADAEENADDSEETVSEEDDDEEEKVEEGIYESYANSADDTFEADIDFMTKVISGGLNKQKSTGQTTIPVIAGQKTRMGADGLGSPMKESTDLLHDFKKLSGL